VIDVQISNEYQPAGSPAGLKDVPTPTYPGAVIYTIIGNSEFTVPTVTET